MRDINHAINSRITFVPNGISLTANCLIANVVNSNRDRTVWYDSIALLQIEWNQNTGPSLGVFIIKFITCTVRFFADMLLCRIKSRTSRAEEPLVSPRFTTASRTRAMSWGFDGRTIFRFSDLYKLLDVRAIFVNLDLVTGERLNFSFIPCPARPLDKLGVGFNPKCFWNKQWRSHVYYL